MDKSPKVAMWKAVGFYKEWVYVGNTGLKKDFFTTLWRSPTREFTNASTSTTWAVFAPELLRSASQWSLDPSWQGFELKKRYRLLSELRYTGGQAPNTHTYSFSAVPTKDPNGKSMYFLWNLKAARDNCITIVIFVSITR